VTRSPFLKFGSMPTFPSHVLISGPPPCTNTGLTPTHASRTRSLMTPCFNVGSFMAAPPYFTTTVRPRNACKYGSASASIFTRSRSVGSETCRVAVIDGIDSNIGTSVCDRCSLLIPNGAWYVPEHAAWTKLATDSTYGAIGARQAESECNRVVQQRTSKAAACTALPCRHGCIRPCTTVPKRSRIGPRPHVVRHFTPCANDPIA